MKEIDKRIPIVVEACEDKKAIDTRVLDVRKLTSIADYFLITSGNSTLQAKAIADSVEYAMDKKGYSLDQKEGFTTGRWILLDYGDIVVHVFHREDREFYNLERLWADGKEIKIYNM